MPVTLSTLVVLIAGDHYVRIIARILLGWPGELSDPDSTARTVWGVLSTVSFLFIVWVLFTQLGRSLGRQPEGVDRLVDGLRWLLLATWGVYPLADIAPSVISDAATAEVVRQVGYSVADLAAKPLFGLLILAIALIKTRADGAAAAHPARAPQVPVSTN
jgi:bacteriorhodopsin